MLAMDRDTSAPVNTISSTSNGHLTASRTNSSTRSPTSSFFRNRFSNASLLSLSSIRTLLPQYSVVDTLEEPPASPPTSESTTENQSHAPSSWSSPSAMEPPRYSMLQPRQSLVLTRGATATRFEVEGGPQDEFQYAYPIRPKNPWATLHLHTRVTVPGDLKSLQNQPRVPRFWSCNPITGIVQLDLDSAQNIQQISISIHGSIILSFHSGGSLPFLKREFTVWSKLHSDNTDSDNTQKKIDARLVAGQHMFPFSFPFPTQTDPDADSISPFNPPSPTSPPDTGLQNTEKLQRRWTRRFTSDESPSSSKRSQASDHPHVPLGSERRSFTSLPQTFMEKGIDPNVAYDISVRIVHGRFKSNSKIKTPVAYFPASEPPPVSQKRREAYEAGALIPCPMDDPEGWFALPTVKTYGVVKINDNLVHTRVDCMLYIAHPLAYTRGSFIPCFITIHSDGVDVVHLLRNAEMPIVRLLRRVWHPAAQYESSPGQVMGLGAPTKASWAQVIVANSDLSLVAHEVASANWWMPSKDIVQGPTVRHLEGEIHLSPDLQPNCAFPSFRIEYAVELLSFQTANFKPEVHPPSPGNLQTDDNVIASNSVEITTLYRKDEPVPIAHSEPPKTYHKRRIMVSADKLDAISENDK